MRQIHIPQRTTNEQVFLTMVEHHENGDPRVTLRQDQRERWVSTKGPGHKNSRSIQAPRGDISRLDFAVQLNVRHHMEPTPGSFDEAFFNLTRRSADELHCKRFKKKDDKRQMLEIFRHGVERRAGGSSGDGLTTRRSCHDRAPRTTTCYLVETGASLERNRQLTCRRGPMVRTRLQGS